MEKIRNSAFVKYILLVCATIMGSALMVSPLCSGPIDRIFPNWRGSALCSINTNTPTFVMPDGTVAEFEVISSCWGFTNGELTLEATIAFILLLPLSFFLFAIIKKMARKEIDNFDESH